MEVIFICAKSIRNIRKSFKMLFINDMRWRIIKRQLGRCKKQILFWCICLIFCWKICFRQPQPVVILMWTQYWDLDEDRLLQLMHIGRNDSDNCFNGVKITYDREQLEEATAIIFYPKLQHPNISCLPQTRRADQLWIALLTESPPNCVRIREPFNSMINWTMSYRKDSDIYAPYGKYFELDKEEDVFINGVHLDDFIRGKTRLLAGVISKCKTSGRREDFVKKLNTEGNISIDIFGHCGKPICERMNRSCGHKKWWKELGAKYKFYLAAENSICTDYITEKFWRSLEIGVVPVVYGGADYSQFAPPHSYIDVRDFESARDVGNFLKRLDMDEAEYKKYFGWRKRYKVEKKDNGTGIALEGWCELSNKVKQFRQRVDNYPRVLQPLFKTISDLNRWWNTEAGSNRGACGKPPM